MQMRLMVEQTEIAKSLHLRFKSYIHFFSFAKGLFIYEYMSLIPIRKFFFFVFIFCLKKIFLIELRLF